MKKPITFLFVFLMLTTLVGQGIDEPLPNRIGIGHHASLINTISSLIGLGLKNVSSTDIFRYKNVSDVEYFNGTTWVFYDTKSWENVLDGNYASSWGIPHEHVRFVVDLGGSWIYPSAILVSQDWGPSDNAYFLKVETSSDLNVWSLRLDETQALHPNTALNTFMTNSSSGSDRYVRVTLSSNATSTNPMRINTLSAFTKRSTGVIQPISINYDQNVGIGTATPTEKLEVNGTIRSKEVKVEASPWPDYVFADNYELPSLEEIEQFIQSNKHLPEIPSKEEIEANGLQLGEMNRLLLKKIEELTLYIIEQQKLILKQGEVIEDLKSIVQGEHE